MRGAVRALAGPLLALGLASPFAAAQAPAPISAPAPITRFQGGAAPAVVASDRAGRPVRLSELRGRIVIVNLWATWCPPCRAEMPSLERLAARYPNDLVVLAVSNDTDWPAIDRFWGDRFPHLRLARAPGPDLARRLGALGLPYSLILDREGREIARLPQSAQWDQGPLAALIARSVADKER